MFPYVSKDILLETGLIILGCAVIFVLYSIENVAHIFTKTPTGKSPITRAPRRESGDCRYDLQHSQTDYEEPEERNFRFDGYVTLTSKISEPDDWPNQFHAATGFRQSPININLSQVTLKQANMHRPLTFNKQYFAPPQRMTILNDGYSVLLGTCFLDEFPTITGGPLGNRYRFNLAQFRWGPSNDEGSEHTIESKRFAMEMQLMHIRGERVYENLEEAARHKSLVFLSFLFEVTKHDNPYLAPLVNNLCRIMLPNTPCDLDPFPLCWLFQPFKARYFYYKGSITCPPCTEGADWIIQQEPLAISSQQLNTFRSVMGVSGPILSNARPVQELNSRKVEFYI